MRKNSLCMPDLLSRIKDALDKCPYLACTPVAVEIVGKEIVLTGVVRSFHQKQMAQVAILHFQGVDGLSIKNKLEVSKKGEH